MPRAFLALLLVAACGGGSGTTHCAQSQVEVDYLRTSNDHTECQPIPTECGGQASCADAICISAMYDLCAPPTIGVGCSDSYPPTIISCNP